MRINLRCPFQDKDLAKQLGARWDAKLRVWYVENRDDLTPFARWLPDLAAPGTAVASPKAAGTQADPVARSQGRDDSLGRHGPVVTGPSMVADCGCTALPWEACACGAGQPIAGKF